MNQILYSGKKNNTPTTLIASIAGVALLIVFLIGFAVINMFNHKILSGVYAADIDVSNMTKEEAARAISKGYAKTLPKSLVLDYEGNEIVIDTKDIGITYTDVDELAEKAYNYGREDNIFVNNYNVLMSYFNSEKRIEAEEVVDDNKLIEAVNKAISEEGWLKEEESYKFSGDKVLLVKVKEDKKVDFDTLKTKILEALEENKTSIKIPFVKTESNSLDRITETEVNIADVEDVLFKNVIATYSAKYSDSSVENAASKCNDVIIYPGEEFSFKKTMKNENGANGYTQMASILYNAVLRADLKVVERKANSIWTQFVPQSTDAMVSDSADFIFENDRKNPVKIVTSCMNGVCTVSIYGIKDNDDYEINVETKILETINYTTNKQNDSSLAKGKNKVVQSPLNGYVSEAYKVYYKDGEEVSRKLVSKDTYNAVEEIIKVGTKVVKQKTTQTKPATTPVQQPVPQTTPYVDPNFVLPTGWDVPESGY